MLEKCSNLYECEEVLSASLDNIVYLGEVDFSIEDIKKLSAFIKEKFCENEGNGVKLLRGFPACLSLYLVGKGINNYQGGEFWPPIIEELDINENKTQFELGDIFLNFIKDRELFHFRIGGGLSYVTPILLHGGIPHTCLYEFYDKVARYILVKGLIEERDIRDEISRIRESEKQRQELLESKERLLNKIKNFIKDIECLKNIITLKEKQLELEQKIEDRKTWADLPDYHSFIATNELQLLVINQRIEELLNKKAKYYEKSKSLTPDDQKLLNLSGIIEGLVKEFIVYKDVREKITSLEAEKKVCEDEFNLLASIIWRWGKAEQYYHLWLEGPYESEIEETTIKVVEILPKFLASELTNLSSNSPSRPSHIPNDFDEFVSLAKEQSTLSPLVTSGEAFIDRLMELEVVCREYQYYKKELAELKRETAEWETFLEQVGVALQSPIAGTPEQIIAELTNEILRTGIKKKEADNAKETLERELFPALHDYINRRAQIEREIEDVEQKIRELGKGDLKSGLRELEEKKRALEELKEVEKELAQCILSYKPDDLDEAWIDLPGYYQLNAAKNLELSEIKSEFKKLKEVESECLERVKSYTPNDQRLLELTEVINRLAQGLKLYQERKERKILLKMEADRCTEKIGTLATEVWPGGWDDRYGQLVQRLNIQTIDQEFTQFIETTQIKDKLEQLKIEAVQPSPLVMLGGIIAFIGIGMLLATHNSVSYIVLFTGLVFWVGGYFHFKKAQGEREKQEKLQEGYKQELLKYQKDLEGRWAKLSEILDGIPVSFEMISASDKDWIDRLRLLQVACRESQQYEQELVELELETVDWEKSLEQLAVTLQISITGRPEQVVAEITDRLMCAGIKKKEANEAKDKLEKEVFPALHDYDTRRAQIEKEIADVEQKIKELERYIALKKKQEELIEIAADPETWIDIPDYRQFIAAKELELSEIKSEIKKLKEMEKEFLKLVKSYTPNDQRLLELTEVINGLVQDFKLYQERKERQILLEMEEYRWTKKIEDLAADLWPVGWNANSLGIDGSQQEFIKKLTSLGRLDKLLNVWINDLKRLQTLHYGYRGYTDQLSVLRVKLAEWEEKVQRVAATLPIHITGPLEQAIDELNDCLIRARVSQREADEAKEILEKEVFPVLDRVESERAKIKREIARAEQRIRELGNGDLETGVLVLDEKKRALAELEEIEKRLRQYSDRFPKEFKNWQEAVSLQEEKEIELEKNKIDLSKIDKQLEHLTTPFEYTDEPVQRFVIYGGEWAIKWLYACTTLYRHYLGEIIELNAVAKGLPARVFDQLNELVRSVKEEKSVKCGPRQSGGKTEKVTPGEPRDGEPVRERFSKPELLLDVARGELKIVVGGHRFHIFNPESPPEIYVRIVGRAEPSNWEKEILLRGYIVNGMVEIPQEEFYLEFFTNEYQVIQYIGGIARYWQVKVYDEHPLVIFSEKGKRINPDRLVERRAWLLYPGNIKIFPENAILTENYMNLNGDTYKLLLINFLLEPVINLTGQEGRIYEIKSSITELPNGPFLSDEEIIKGAWTERKRPIYIGELPKLCVPYKDKEEIDGWNISILKNWSEGSAEKLIDGKNIAILGKYGERSCFDIYLTAEELLGPNALGEYVIVLHHYELGEYRFDLVIFPDLMLYFNPLLYFPQEEEDGEARLTVVIPLNIRNAFQIKVKKPARLTGREGDEIHINIGLEYGTVEFELIYTVEGRRCGTVITVEIPKVKWRIYGKEEGIYAEWCQCVKEVWHEVLHKSDSARLEINLPWYLIDSTESVKVYLAGTNQQVSTKGEGRFLRFDLSGLADTLRGGKEIYSLWLSLGDSKGRPKYKGKIFDIRCQWRVDCIQYAVKEEWNERVLRVTWVDRGEAQDRVARLWLLWEPWVEPMEFVVPDGACELEIAITELPPGPYLLCFDIDDQWDSKDSLVEFPQKIINAKEINIEGARGKISISECNWIGQGKLRVSGSLNNVEGKKEIMAVLCGISNGEYRVVTETKYIDDNNFSYILENLFQKPISKTGRFHKITKKIVKPHWLGVIVRGIEPIYHFQVLPDPGMLGWPLSLAFIDQQIIKDGQIYIDCFEESLDDPLLSKELSERVLSQWRRGDREIMARIKIEGEFRNIKLCKADDINEFKIELETAAVKCTSCGKIEPDQHAWHRKHYPKCKSFNFNFKEINVSLYWYSDIASVINQLKERYSIAGNHFLTLYDNRTRPLPDSIWQELTKKNFQLDIEILVKLMWEKEKFLLSIWEGHFK